MKRFLKFLSVFFLMVFLVSCAKTEVSPKFFFMVILKRASMEAVQPNGFFQFGCMIEEKDKELLTSSSLKDQVKSIELTNPKGQKYKIDPYRRFDTSSKDYWHGNVVMGEKEKQIIWLGSDFAYNEKNLPPEGEYKLSITSKSGDIFTATAEFNAKKENQLKGYIENLKYNQKTRTATWKAIPGEGVHYRVYLFKGEKQDGVEDWSKMVFASRPTTVPEPTFVFPKDVVLEKGQKYYIMVEGWKIPYFSVQDKKDKVVSFISE